MRGLVGGALFAVSFTHAGTYGVGIFALVNGCGGPGASYGLNYKRDDILSTENPCVQRFILIAVGDSRPEEKALTHEQKTIVSAEREERQKG